MERFLSRPGKWKLVLCEIALGSMCELPHTEAPLCTSYTMQQQGHDSVHVRLPTGTCLDCPTNFAEWHPVVYLIMLSVGEDIVAVYQAPQVAPWFADLRRIRICSMPVPKFLPKS